MADKFSYIVTSNVPPGYKIGGAPVKPGDTLLLTASQAEFEVSRGIIRLSGGSPAPDPEPDLSDTDRIAIVSGATQRLIALSVLKAFIGAGSGGGSSPTISLSTTSFLSGVAQGAILAVITPPTGWTVAAETTFGGRVAVSGNNLVAAQALTTDATGTIRLRATSPSGTESVTKTFDVAVSGTPADTTPPVIITAGAQTIAENAVLSLTLQASEAVTWSKIGGANASDFTLTSSGSPSTTATLSLPGQDYEALPTSNKTRSVIIRAVDAAGNSVDKTFTITITDVDESLPDTTPPVITSSATGSIAENAVFSMALTANENVTWAIAGGADAARFTLSGSTLSMAAKDFEAPTDANGDNVYTVQVRATDTAGNATTQTINVTVTNVLEGTMAAISPTTGSTAASDAASTVVLDLPAMVEGESRSYIVTTGPSFAINSSGKLIRGVDTWTQAGTATGKVRQTRGGVNTDTPVTITLKPAMVVRATNQGASVMEQGLQGGSNVVYMGRRPAKLPFEAKRFKMLVPVIAPVTSGSLTGVSGSQHVDTFFSDVRSFQRGISPTYAANGAATSRQLFTFGGAEIATYDPATWDQTKVAIESDWLELATPIPANTDFEISNAVRAPAGKLPYTQNHFAANQPNHGYIVSASDIMAANGGLKNASGWNGMSSAAGGSVFYDNAIILVEAPSGTLQVLSVGDSNLYAYGYDKGDAYGIAGVLCRGITNRKGAMHVSFGRGSDGDYNQGSIPANNALRRKLAAAIHALAPFDLRTHAHGTNDATKSWTSYAWTADTDYVRGQSAYVNGNGTFVCTKSGRSKASGTLSGSGRGIVDGTAEWAQVSTGNGSADQTLGRMIGAKMVVMDGYRAALPNVPVWDVTVPPMSTSTDNWATVANQSVTGAWFNGANGIRGRYNALIRGLLDLWGAVGFIDPNLYIEDAWTPVVTGKWRGDGVTAKLYTVDGTHYSDAGAVLASQVVDGLGATSIVITKTGDGSQGQIYTAMVMPLGTPIQWTRTVKGSTPLTTDIAGATALAYTSTADDLSCYLGARTQDGKVKAQAPGWVLPVAPLIDSMDSLTGWPTGTDFVQTINTARASEGAGAIQTALKVAKGSDLILTHATGQTLDANDLGIIIADHWHDGTMSDNSLTLGVQIGGVNIVAGDPSYSSDPIPARIPIIFDTADISGKPSTPAAASTYLRIGAKNPRMSRPIIDQVRRKAAGIPTNVHYFDDAIRSSWLKLGPYAKDRNLLMTYAIPVDSVRNTLDSSGFMCKQDIVDILAAGHRVIPNLTPDDVKITDAKYSSIEFIVSEYKRAQAFLRALGVPEEYLKHVVYSNGEGWAPYAVKMRPTDAVYDGQGNVSLTAAQSTGPAIGMKYAGWDVTTGLPVVSNITAVTDSTHFKVDYNYPDNSQSAAANAKLAIYYLENALSGRNLADRLKAEGVKTARLTTPWTNKLPTSRLGIPDPLLIPSQSFTNADAAAMIGYTITTPKKYGCTIFSYTHGVADDTAGSQGIGIYETPGKQWLDAQATERQADTMHFLPPDLLLQRDGVSGVNVWA